MQFMDAAPLSGVRITSDGYLVADARIARTGVQTYTGREVGSADRPAVRVYRAADEVFSAEALASMAHRPVTNDHPATSVTAANWRTHAVGMTGGEVARDGEFVRVPMTLMDATAIADVQAGKRELSVGYGCDLDWSGGVTTDGQVYDAAQINIRGNHVALVDAGRAGARCRIGDRTTNHAQPEFKGDRQVALKTIIVDGFQVETTDAGEAAITKLRGMLTDALNAMEVATAKHAQAVAQLAIAHQEAVAAKDAELGAKDAALADVATKGVTGAQLDQLVADRTTVIGRAKALAPAIVTDGQTNAAVRRAAVEARIGAGKLDGKADAYVDALFENLTLDDTVDPLRAAIIDAKPAPTVDLREAAHAKMVEGLKSAWKAS